MHTNSSWIFRTVLITYLITVHGIFHAWPFFLVNDRRRLPLRAGLWKRKSWSYTPRNTVIFPSAPLAWRKQRTRLKSQSDIIEIIWTTRVKRTSRIKTWNVHLIPCVHNCPWQMFVDRFRTMRKHFISMYYCQKNIEPISKHYRSLFECVETRTKHLGF